MTQSARYCTRYLALTESEACSETCQTAKMERLGPIITVYRLTNVVKPSILDVCKGSEYASGPKQAKIENMAKF